ncbi:MAG: TetR/AcrR family transcriptional regulator [Actinomycetota bacterium]|nr:TetR/AcrR family transcriptional regulator [Actinomycetota bacterium]
MAKTGPRGQVRPRSTDGHTRERLVEAAIETLKHEGFAGSSARAIASAAGVNQALVFYHFGTVNDLLLAALDTTSERRMARYREAVANARGPDELIGVARDIYREDLAAGHLTVLGAVIAGASTVPELGPALVERIEPWTRFTAEHLGRMLDGSPLAGLVPAEDAAFAIVALYLGMELLTSLDGDQARAESLFAALERLSAPLATLLGANTVGTLGKDRSHE